MCVEKKMFTRKNLHKKIVRVPGQKACFLPYITVFKKLTAFLKNAFIYYALLDLVHKFLNMFLSEVILKITVYYDNICHTHEH